jgi:hypothetical protein
MNAIGVIQTGLASTKNILHMYLADLSDADLLVRPVPEANHIAWQVGHVTLSEHHMISKNVPGGIAPTLPPGFAEKHNKDAASKNSGFLTKKEYLETFDKVREATMAAAAKMTEADLDRPTGWDFAPTLGSLMMLTANHVMMHAGQFTVVRRKLGKPVIF